MGILNALPIRWYRKVTGSASKRGAPGSASGEKIFQNGIQEKIMKITLQYSTSSFNFTVYIIHLYIKGSL